MQQLTYLDTRQLEWRDVAAPTLPDDDAVIVRPLTVSTCDMDGVVIHGLLKLKGPTPIGHEGEGVVTEVGSNVARWRVGDRVIIPWKIACGHCPTCRRGHTAQCADVPPEDAYGWGPTAPSWGGFLSDAVVVPNADFMLTALPEGVDPTLACGVADNISDGWRAVGPHLAARPGGTVLVSAMAPPGSIGLYAAGIAVSLGAERVVFADYDPGRLQIAERLGAEPLNLAKNSFDAFATDAKTLGGGFDVTVDASGNPQLLPQLIAATARAGVCISTAGIVYRNVPIPFDVYGMYRKSLSFHTGWAHTQSFVDEPLALISEGRFDPSPVTTKVVDWSDAAQALCEPFTKLVIRRDA